MGAPGGEARRKELMRRTQSGILAVLALVALALAACSSGPSATHNSTADLASESPPAGAQTLDIPAPRSPKPSGPRAGQPGRLSWTVPTHWTAEPREPKPCGFRE